MLSAKLSLLFSVISCNRQYTQWSLAHSVPQSKHWLQQATHTMIPCTFCATEQTLTATGNTHNDPLHILWHRAKRCNRQYTQWSLAHSLPQSKHWLQQATHTMIPCTFCATEQTLTATGNTHNDPLHILCHRANTDCNRQHTQWSLAHSVTQSKTLQQTIYTMIPCTFPATEQTLTATGNTHNDPLHILCHRANTDCNRQHTQWSLAHSVPQSKHWLQQATHTMIPCTFCATEQTLTATGNTHNDPLHILWHRAKRCNRQYTQWSLAHSVPQSKHWLQQATHTMIPCTFCDTEQNAATGNTHNDPLHILCHRANTDCNRQHTQWSLAHSVTQSKTLQQTIYTMIPCTFCATEQTLTATGNTHNDHLHILCHRANAATDNTHILWHRAKRCNRQYTQWSPAQSVQNRNRQCTHYVPQSKNCNRQNTQRSLAHFVPQSKHLNRQYTVCATEKPLQQTIHTFCDTVQTLQQTIHTMIPSTLRVPEQRPQQTMHSLCHRANATTVKTHILWHIEQTLQQAVHTISLARSVLRSKHCNSISWQNRYVI